MTLKEKYESLLAAGANPYVEMGKGLIDNISLYGLGVHTQV